MNLTSIQIEEKYPSAIIQEGATIQEGAIIRASANILKVNINL